MSMTIQEAIKRIINHMEIHHIGEPPHIKIGSALLMAIAALMEKAERENPVPLTLEEVRQMDGEPVWIKADHYGIFADVVRISGKDDGDHFVGLKICYRLQENGYGKTWLAYRHKPKEAQ